jgi:hypothetical protein
LPATPTTLIALTWKFALSKVGTDMDIAEFTVNCHKDSYEPDDAQLLKLADGGYKAWQGHIDPTLWCDNVFLVSVAGRTFSADGHTFREQVWTHGPTDWVGTATGAALPWETSMALGLYTYPRGSFVANARRKRGRIYLPPMAANVLDPSNSGFFSNANLPTLLANLHEFMSHVGEDDIGASVVKPGVYSRVDGAIRDVTQLSLDAKIDSQRRRQNRETSGWLNVDL